MKLKIDKESVRLVVSLAVIAFFAALVLSVVHMFTIVDEEARLREKIGEVYSAPLTEQTFDWTGYVDRPDTSISNCYRAEDGAYIIIAKSDKAYSNSGIELIVIIKDDLIKDVIKYKASETPGIGSKLLEDSYLKQFTKYSVDDFDFASGTAGGAAGIDVAYVTGATRSSTGVRYAVEAAVKAYLFLEGK